MEKRSYPMLLLVALLTASGLYRPTGRETAPRPVESATKTATSAPSVRAGGSPGKNRQKPKASRDSAVGQDSDDEAIEEIHRFMGIGDKEKHSAPCLKTREYDTEFLLVTVPDPFHSQHSYLLDGYIEGIQRAAEDSGYILDTYKFPWKEEPQPGGATAGERRLDEDEHERLEKMPGLLLFRGAEVRSNKLLIILLIPEMPTAGINRFAFKNALQDLRHLAGSAPSQAIRIMGPSFSGSSRSLRQAIEEVSAAKDAPTHFWIVSGTATGYENRCEISSPERADIVYQTVIENDSYSLDHFIDHLRLQEVRASQIAFVSESGSSYGEQIASYEEQPAPDGGQTNETKKDDCKPHPDREPPNGQPFSFPIPMGISHVRNAYQDDPDLILWSQKQGQMPRQTLKLKLKDTRGTRDVIPKFAPEQTVISQETALLNITHALATQKFKYVGIAATDVLDNLFVARMVQEHCPDARLFVFEPDLLYQHSEQGQSFEGTLLLGTYPLFSKEQQWTGYPSRLLEFANQGAFGVYNACRLLLSKSSAEGRPDLRNRPLIDYTWPLYLQPRAPQQRPPRPYPPLWLAVVGSDGIWPLAILNGDEPEPKTASKIAGEDKSPGGYSSSLTPVDQKAVLPKDLPLPLPYASRTWWTLLWFLTGSCLLHNLIFLYHNGKRGTEGKDWFATFKIYPESPQAPGKHLFHLVAALSLVGVYLPFVIVQVAVYFHPDFPWGYAKAAFVGIVPLTLLTFLIPIIGCASGLFPSTRARVGETLFAGVALVLQTIFCVRSTMLWWHLAAPLSQDSKRELEGLFFVLRATHPSNGLSAVIPLALFTALIYLWALTQLRRLHLNETMPWNLPMFLPKDESNQRRQTAEKKVIRALNHTFFDPWETAGIGLIWLIYVALNNPASPRGLEGPAFDFLCAMIMITVCGLVLFSASRLLYLWIHLKRLLHVLDWHPVRGAFSRISEELSWKPMWHQLPTEQIEIALVSSKERLRSLLSAAYTTGDARRKLTLLCSRIDQRAGMFLQAESRGKITSNEFRAIQRRIEIASLRVTDCVLRERWSDRACATNNSVVKATTGEIVAPREEFERAAEEFVALRFVAFIWHIHLQFRNLLGFLSTAFVLVVIALNSYAFVPYRALMWSVTSLFTVIGASVFWMFIQMHRDAILRRLAGNKPGGMDGNLIFRLVSIGALPFVTILSAQFPTIGHFLFSWVQPALEAVR